MSLAQTSRPGIVCISAVALLALAFASGMFALAHADLGDMYRV